MIDVESYAHDLEDHASRDNMGVMHHPAADVMRKMLKDLAFLSEQLDTMEHDQDHAGIAHVRGLYGIKRSWE